MKVGLLNNMTKPYNIKEIKSLGFPRNHLLMFYQEIYSPLYWTVAREMINFLS